MAYTAALNLFTHHENYLENLIHRTQENKANPQTPTMSERKRTKEKRYLTKPQADKEWDDSKELVNHLAPGDTMIGVGQKVWLTAGPAHEM